MTHLFYSSHRLWPSIALVALASTSVYAQTSASVPPAAAVSKPAAPLAFSSAFEGYQPYTDEKTANWRQANDNTARIGGWRAYAKEAAEPAPATAPSLVPSPAKP